MIVIFELVFAFGLGLSCILFSFNLVKAVRYDSIDENIVHSQVPVYNILIHGRDESSTNLLTRDTSAATSTATVTNISLGASVRGDPFIREPAYNQSYSAFSDTERGSEFVGNERPSEVQNVSLMEGILKNFTEYIRVW